MSKTQAATITSLPLDKILIREGFNPRKDLGNIDDLVNMIKTQGLINPLTVCPSGDGAYYLVAGGRRHAAVQALGLKEVAVTVHNVDIDSPEAKGIALAENFEGGRHNLSDMDLAKAYQEMFDKLRPSCKDVKACNIAVGKIVGVSFKSIEYSRKLLDAPVSIQEKLERGELSKAGVSTLVSVPEEIRSQVADRISKTEGSVTEKDVRRLAKSVNQEHAPSNKVVDLEAEDSLSSAQEEDVENLPVYDVCVWRSKKEVKAQIESLVKRATQFADDGDIESKIETQGALSALLWMTGAIDEVETGSADFKRAMNKLLGD